MEKDWDEQTLAKQSWNPDCTVPEVHQNSAFVQLYGLINSLHYESQLEMAFVVVIVCSSGVSEL